MRLPAKKYYSLEEVADQWDCSISDLLHYAEIGKLEICLYVYLGFYEAAKDVQGENAKRVFTPSGPCHIAGLIPEQWRIMRLSGHLNIKKQPAKFLVKHPFEEAYLKLERDFHISELIVTNEEKLRFEAACDLASNTKATTHRIDINEPHEVDEFVGSLTIYPENNDTINIQIPGRKAEPFTGHSLGFHKTGKEWRLLQKIIQEGRYCTGSTKTKDGDANRKCLTTVNKKMIKFLNENFNAEIPPDYKLFEISAEHDKD